MATDMVDNEHFIDSYKLFLKLFVILSILPDFQGETSDPSGFVVHRQIIFQDGETEDFGGGAAAHLRAPAKAHCL